MFKSLEDIQTCLNTHIQTFTQTIHTLNSSYHDSLVSTQLALLDHLSLCTEKPCIPCGVIHLGNDRLLFAYRRGPDPSISVEDTLYLYQLEKLEHIHLVPLEKQYLDPAFREDLKGLSEHFPEAAFTHMLDLQDKKVIVFKTDTSTKMFWWHVEASGAIHYRGQEDHFFSLPQGPENKNLFDTFLETNYPNMIRSPHGEDILYTFYHQDIHILSFHSRQATQKITCRGYTLLDDGRLVILGNQEEQAHSTHPVQIWQTPYLSTSHHFNTINQAELERGILEAHHLIELLQTSTFDQAQCERIIRFIHSLKNTFTWLEEVLQTFLEPLHALLDWTKNHHRQSTPLPILELHEETTMLGKYTFQVNTQPFEWTIVPYSDTQVAYHLQGTQLFELIDVPQFYEFKDHFNQKVAFESVEVYRGEYFALLILNTLDEQQLSGLALEALTEIIFSFIYEREPTCDEECVHDTVQILEKLLPLSHAAGLLRFTSSSRALAQLFWAFCPDPSQCKLWEKSAKNLYHLQTFFNGKAQDFSEQLIEEFRQSISAFLDYEQFSSHFSPHEIDQAGTYLLAELSRENVKFTANATAMQDAEQFWKELEQHHQRRIFEEDLRMLKNSIAKQFLLTQAWLKSVLHKEDPETVVIVLTHRRIQRQVNATPIQIEITNLKGQHPRIHEGNLVLQLDEFFERLEHFINVQSPRFHRYHQFLEQLLSEKNRTNNIHPAHPPQSFVQNCLIQHIYLDLIGENLAQQLSPGQAHSALLLFSPMGYGKTTLIEYIAYRLGVYYLRIDCTGLGPQVTSLHDPSHDALIHQELEKIHFAFAMGQRVLLFLDNIQACSPEFLQKLIAQEVVGRWNHQPITYRSSERRFALVMAADLDAHLPEHFLHSVQVINLAYHVFEHEAAFTQSLLENALVYHPILAPLANRDLNDVDQLLRLAQGEDISIHECSYPYSEAELQTLLPLLKNLARVQTVVSQVNQHYLHSWIQTDRYRQEPAFTLPGNYSTMVQLVAKLKAEMNEAEVDAIIDAYYLEQAYTLSQGREENILKFIEIRHKLTLIQTERWLEIQHALHVWKNPNMVSYQGNGLAQQLHLVSEGLQNICSAIIQIGELKSLNVYLAALPKLVQSLAKVQMDIEVINQLPTGWEDSLKMMIEMVEKSLLPIVQEYERKSKLDLVMFERVKDMSQILKELQKEILAKGKTYKQYKVLNLNKE